MCYKYDVAQLSRFLEYSNELCGHFVVQHLVVKLPSVLTTHFCILQFLRWTSFFIIISCHFQFWDWLFCSYYNYCSRVYNYDLVFSHKRLHESVSVPLLWKKYLNVRVRLLAYQGVLWQVFNYRPLLHYRELVWTIL